MNVPILSFFDITAHKHGGNPESRGAHARAVGTKAAIWARIMRFAAQLGARGFAPDELASIWQRSPNHVVPRCTELKANAQLVPTKRTGPTRSGSAARVLVSAEFAAAVRLQPTSAPPRAGGGSR